MCETNLTLPIFYVHFNDINWGKFVLALMDIRYEGPAVIETEDMAFENSLACQKNNCAELQLSESICVLIIHSTEQIKFTYES
jgi:hypothetical protein